VAKNPSVKSAKVRHTVRIIGGLYKRTPIQVVDAPGLRPSPDRVRETLFNWLGQDLSGWRCLDLFAGTGVLGFEAASRGAESAILVESHRLAVQSLQATQLKLKASAVQILNQDSLKAINRFSADPAARFDLVFLDPPFDQDWYSKVLPLLPTILTAQGLLYLESALPWPAVAVGCETQWQLLKQDKAGQVHFHLLKVAA
jgi:16S rRNA (guanine966-N2)-methyltransferase